MSYAFHPTILREYDIRGIVGQTLSAECAYWIGRGFGTAVIRSGGRVVCTGRDGRLSSPELEEAVARGLAESGCAVRRTGRGPTPMLYYATTALKADGGIMITGSHNPPTHNGFKMMLGGKSFYGTDISTLGRRVAKGDLEKGKGILDDHPMLEEYVGRIARDYHGLRPLKVVWDAGNGAAGEAMELLTDRLPGEHILLNATIDGTFPAHHPDPTEPKNLVQLQDKVISTRADLGVAFDGDGDRIGVVDGKGRIMWGDQMMMLLAEEVLRERPGATIIADVKASQTLFDEIARLGGQPLMWRTGHSLIKAKIVETDAPLAGEMSGHIFFADKYFGYDDALYAAVRFISIVASMKETLAERFDRMPHPVNTPELRFDCPDERKFGVIEEVKARLKATPEAGEVNDIDGVRVLTKHGWWLLRASNTQAVLVARCESRDAGGLDTLKAELAGQLRASG
ncbi:MAG: phosphomannomutase, partial [Alphaproteobacteria bacterium RIFOXYD12_FULL_60_8]